MSGILSALLGTATGNTGNTVTVGNEIDYVFGYEYWGYSSTRAVPFGAISPLTWPFSSSNITDLYYGDYGVATQVALTISGAHSQSDFTTVNINGTVLTSASATFSSGANSSWYWSPVANPFGFTIGDTKQVTWS